MANNKQRYINTRFWNDTYISDLDPIEKLLFIYFLTNEHTNISGVYELPLKIIGIETGIDVSMLKKIFPRLKNKIGYIDGIVVVKNFIKHQETGSPLVKKGILNCLKDFDIEFLKNIVKQGYYTLPKEYCDTLCIPYAKGLNYSNSNLDSNLDSIAEQSSALIVEIIKEFESVDLKNKTYYGNKTQRGACDFLIESYGYENVISVIKLLPKTNTMEFMPTVTTPVQLRDKWVQLSSGIQRIKEKKIKNITNVIV